MLLAVAQKLQTRRRPAEMPDLFVSVPHQLSQDEALKRVQQSIHKARFTDPSAVFQSEINPPLGIDLRPPFPASIVG
jgi:hypothetical protein